MFTICPACTRQFRVRASQLAQAEGLVQCGFCGKQFNALERLYDKPMVIDIEPMAVVAEEDSAVPDFYIPEIEEDSRHVENLDASPAETEVNDAPVSKPLPIEKSNAVGYPFPAELVEAEAPTAGTVSRLLWSVGVLILLLAGTAQAAWFYRDVLLNQYPQFLPQAKQVCRYFNCTLVRNRNISAIKLLNRDVRVHPRYEDALLVNATMTNLSKYAQRFPQVLLSLYDTSGKVIAYRPIPASDYLDGSIDVEAGMTPDSPIHFVLEIANTGTDAVSFEFDFL